MSDLAQRIREGDVQALARAATFVQNRTAEGRELVAELYCDSGSGLVVGVTGPPGAGKSTLLAQLARHLRTNGRRVGILAVDPSSTLTSGAVLGDRIRMAEHWSDSGVFIRSLATRGTLGGLAPATFDLTVLLRAGGFDAILIETVGVGQGEVAVASVADVTAVVLVPGLGDDIQAMKAGILEIADVFAVNKSDLPGALAVAEELRRMQAMAPGVSGGSDVAPICLVSATRAEGSAELGNALERSKEKASRQRAGLWETRLRELVSEEVLRRISPEHLATQANLVAERRQDPYTAVRVLLEQD